MSLFRRTPGTTEQRSISYQDVWGAGGNIAPALQADRVSGALRLAPVYAATSLIADMIATSPIRAYREKTEGIRENLAVQPQLIRNPNPWGTSRIAWFHQGLASVLLTGNAVGYVVAHDSAGTPSKIIWLNPNDITIIEEQEDWFHTPAFYWRGRFLDPALTIHIPGYTVAGSVKGLSPIGLFKTQIETGLHAQSYQLDWFKNGAAPSGWFKNTAQKLKADEATAIKTRFKSAVSNRDLLVTGNDWDWTSLAVPADQAQFLSAIKANATTIASIYKVSPEDIGGVLDKSLTYKTLEQDGIKMTIRALRPWAARFEEALTAILPRPQYAAIDLDWTSRGTVMERMQAHAVALAAGLETNDEARAAENRPPLTSSQVADWQGNYRASTAAEDPAASAAATSDSTGEADNGS